MAKINKKFRKRGFIRLLSQTLKNPKQFDPCVSLMVETRTQKKYSVLKLQKLEI
jgi:hypothetical protein